MKYIMNIYITKKYPNEKNAGKKAPDDIDYICKNMGWKEFNMKLVEEDDGFFKKIYMFLVSIPLQWMRLGIKKSDYILYQHPMGFGIEVATVAFPIIKKIFHTHIVVLIHDLNSLRLKKKNTFEKKLLKQADVIICHNYKMKEYLVDIGIKNKKIVCLTIFDYLCDKNIITKTMVGNKLSIAIAGNLSSKKSGYIYELAKNNQKLNINLYGVGYDDTEKMNNICYKGSFTPEELPNKIEGSFGLVWDGQEINSCSGNYGEYQKYNNPHKFSLYMASEIPVIIWKKAALAKFVEENNVGIVVDDIQNIQNVLQEIDEKNYFDMVMNVKKIAEKVRDGYYFKTAVKVAMNEN